MLRFKRFILENLSVEELSKKLEVTIDDINTLDKDELAIILKHIGEHDFTADSKFDKNELAMGIEVEKEHTSNTIIAKLIAKDHLSEFPDYYTRLKKMENE